MAMRADRAGDDRWTLPARPPLRRAPPPPRRHRRSRLVPALALLGLALAATAGIWYATLGPSTPPARLPVPRVVGLREPAAVRLLTRDGFRVRIHEPVGGGTSGVVVAQVPFPRTTAARGTTVTIRIAQR